MPIRVQCSGCKTTLAVKDHLAGKRVKCPKCQAPLSVPASGSGPMPANKPGPKKPPVAKPEDLEALAAAAFGDEPPATGPPASGSNGSSISSGSNGHSPVADPFIKFICEYCDAEIELAVEHGGKKAQCPECRHIIKVPLPKIEKPKDWRTVEKKGPSLAAMNQPAKIENAWGTETKSRVSQTALLEAGVIARPKKPSIGLAGWIERGVKGTFLVLIVGGIGLGIWKLRQSSVVDKQREQFAKKCDSKWPLVIQAEYHIGLANMTLSQPKQRDAARELHIKAWQLVAPAVDPRDKIDRDFFLIELAKAQLNLGGDEMDIRGRDRFDWDQEVIGDIIRTVNMIDNPDARVTALRELTVVFAEKKQADLAMGLASTVGASTHQAKAFQLAISFADANKPADAARIAKLPENLKSSIDLIARCGYAEAFARKDDFSKAMDLAQAPGDPVHRFQALIAVAATLSLDGKSEKTANAKAACEAASKLLEKDAKANIPAWVLLQHVRLVARFDAEEAKGLSQKLPAAFRRRGQLEVALAALEKSPPPANAVALIHELDKEGPGRGLAWRALARSKARANLAFAFTPDGPEDEMLGPYLQAAVAFASAQDK